MAEQTLNGGSGFMGRLRSIATGTSRVLSWAATAATARLRLATGRPVRFAGAFSSRETALASLPVAARAAYDQDDVADVSYEAMTRVLPWDYPVLFWLQLCLAQQDRLKLLDAGGHLGTKFTGFGDHLDTGRIDWTVWDLPAIIRAARTWQAEDRLPAELAFVDAPAEAGPVDLLLASGLMQYLDRPLADLIAEMAAPPRWILLNKVAVRTGETLVTLERIGPAQVPYQIRSEAGWTAELAALGYEIRDSWDIPGLSHRINTHPWLEPSRSRGFFLERPHS